MQSTKEGCGRWEGGGRKEVNYQGWEQCEKVQKLRRNRFLDKRERGTVKR